jgi:methionyl aminopeptidase
MIPVKSERDLEMLRTAGKILARIMLRLKEFVKEGVTTEEIDRLAETLISQEGVVSAFKGYKGFPANICLSINEEVVHGIPSDRKLQNGDLVSMDVGINYSGYFSDAAVTTPIGRIGVCEKKLIEVTRKSLIEGIRQAKVNNHLSDISHAIQGFVERYGFSVVREFVGHGIGRSLHEDPQIPNFGVAHQGPVLKQGMVLAIEPMVNIGTWEVRICDNGWTAVTKDGLASAHFEHTVAVTEDGPEILTN